MTEELAHYGVKGMRWGVRRSRAERKAARQSNKAAKAAGLDPDSDDVARAKIVSSRIAKNRGRTSSISNSDMKVLIDRMNMESNYQNLMNKEAQAKANRSPFRRGKRKVDEVLDVYSTIQRTNKAIQPLVSKAQQAAWSDWEKNWQKQVTS